MQSGWDTLEGNSYKYQPPGTGLWPPLGLNMCGNSLVVGNGFLDFNDGHTGYEYLPGYFLEQHDLDRDSGQSNDCWNSDGSLQAECTNHNDMEDLESRLKNIPEGSTKLVIADAVFSMDGDVIDFPKVVELSRKYKAWLMIDEAHSVGVLGKTGRGIEEHFGMEGTVDIKMGTLSKTIPSVGGYIAGKQELIDFLSHASRAYIFSAALPPAQAAAAKEAFNVILDEPWRMEKLQANTEQFIGGLKARGFDTMETSTAIVPVLCGDDERAFALTRAAQAHDLFVLPVVSPAVPPGLARLRATVTAAHEPDEIEYAMNVVEQAGKEIGII